MLRPHGALLTKQKSSWTWSESSTCKNMRVEGKFDTRRVENVRRHPLKKSFVLHNRRVLIFWWKQQEASLKTAFAATGVFEVVFTVIVPISTTSIFISEMRPWRRPANAPVLSNLRPFSSCHFCHVPPRVHGVTLLRLYSWDWQAVLLSCLSCPIKSWKLLVISSCQCVGAPFHM